MNTTHINGIAKVSTYILNELEENLIDAEQADPTTLRTRGAPTNDSEVTEMRREIVGIYRHGLEIASAIDCYPLLALLQGANQPIPPKLNLSAQRFDIYLLQLVYSLRLPPDVKPSEAEFAVNLSSGTETKNAPSVLSFFPRESHETKLKISAHAKIGLTGDLDFAVPEEFSQAAGVPFKAKIEASAGATFIAGPFEYELRRATIRADGLNKPRVQWQYLLESELAGSSEFRSWIVVQTEKGLKTLRVLADLGVKPYRKEWLFFKQFLTPMRDSLQAEITL